MSVFTLITDSSSPAFGALYLTGTANNGTDSFASNCVKYLATPVCCAVAHKDNNIEYWKNFVEHYYSRNARQRWCLSQYNHAGVFFRADLDFWKCEFCSCELKRGFDVKFEVLARLRKAYFDSGVTDELLHLDYPSKARLPSGHIVLHCEKAVLESVYSHFRVVHEGQLRVIFTPELKIESWHFCLKRHEEVIPRRLLAAQVMELVQDVERCQSNLNAKGNDGLQRQEFLSNCDKLKTTRTVLESTVDLSLINEFGFSIQYFRSLQVSDIVHSMEGLMSYSLENKMNPLETHTRIKQEHAKAKAAREQMQQLDNRVWQYFAKVGSSSNGGNIFNMPNFIIQTPHDIQQSPYPGHPCRKLTMDPSRLQDLYQSSYNNCGNTLTHSISLGRTLPENHSKQMIKEVLESLCGDKNQGQQSTSTSRNKGKTKLVYDPKK